MVTIDTKTACATCCKTGHMEALTKEVCPGWIDWAPANAWAIIYRAGAHNINATSMKGIQRASEALENRAKRLKPAHVIYPNDATDIEEPLDTDRTANNGIEFDMGDTPENGTSPCRNTTPNRDDGELENPAKRPHIENINGRVNPNGEAQGADNNTPSTNQENEHTTQNWTQHAETEEQ